MKKESRDFQIFAKPVGAQCNLSCRYCYYLGNDNASMGRRPFSMDYEILERYIAQHIEASDGELINFSWHGGEPLLAGIDFFRKIVAVQTRYKPPGRRIINGIQTNGTLIDKQWASFLSSEGFFVGISIDGPGDLHNRYRTTKGKEPTLDRALNGFFTLKDHGILCEILCVVHSSNVDYPLVVYNFFKQLGARYMTFLPLVEYDRRRSTGVSKESVPANEFGNFLTAIFDEWIGKDIGNIKIQIIEEALRTAFNQEHTLCIFKEKCGAVPVVEYNGDFFSCDHYVDKHHLIGNIKDGSVASFLDHKKQKAFGEAKQRSLPQYCIRCEVKAMCNGECPKNRFTFTGDGEPGLNYLCNGYKAFFNHCRPFVEQVGSAWKMQQGQ